MQTNVRDNADKHKKNVPVVRFSLGRGVRVSSSHRLATPTVLDPAKAKRAKVSPHCHRNGVERKIEIEDKCMCALSLGHAWVAMLLT